ncbi:hypothetical protein ACJIZ3_010583 [Penstemon smallii]|uniref:Uncharacterized protein n=1 Tax=Penstemon smallii TaxID=265156 RepID=A0ABD3UIU4_9LAMI
MEGFCIREFASRMRSVDVVKCWPFDETTNEESVKSLLPSIVIKKFTWWVAELEHLNSKSAQNTENSTKKKKKKKKKMGREKGIKNKAPPKKRSIVEIFAVAPQVERVISSDDEDGVQEEINWGVKGKRNEKKKNKEIILNKLKKAKQVIKKTKKKEKVGLTLSFVPNKVNQFSSKLQTEDKGIETRNSSSTSTESENDIGDRLSIHKRKPSMQRLDADKKTMTCEAFISENDNPLLLGNGILKNHSKSYQELSIPVNHFGKQKAHKHVTFTENDEPSVSIATRNELPFSHLSKIEETANRKLEASSQSTAMNKSNSFHSRTSPYLSREEMLHTFCSLPHRNQTGSIDKDFVGLPLNSHGELIPFNSSATLKSFGNHSEFGSWNSRTFSEDMSKPFPVEKEDPVFVMPSRSDITESQTNRITCLDFDLLQINDDSFSIGKEDRKFHQSPENEKIQSTMRLMGQDFKVGRNGFQEFEDGLIWKDNQITDELHFVNNKSISNVMIHDQDEPSLGKLEELMFCPSETTMNHRPEMNLMHQNAFVARTVNPLQSTLTEVYNRESLFPEPFISGYEHLKKNQRCAPRSMIRFPFMHPDFEGPVQSSWSQNSSMNRPPLFFDASEKGRTLSDFQTYRNFSTSHHPSVTTGTNQWTKSSVSLNPDVLYTHDPYPGIVPISAVQRRNGNQKKIREPINSKVGLKGLDRGKKAKRQHSTSSNVPFKQFENPSLGFQGLQRVINRSKNAMGDEYVIYPSMDSYSSIERAGSIKLASGAKHILKASRQNDQNSFRAIDPDIPLVALNTDFPVFRI